MRILLFRTLCDSGGVSTSMQLLGGQMARRGIEPEYWFCQGSVRLDEFLATGKAHVGSLTQLAKRLARGDIDIVQMAASDESAQIVALLAGKARVVVTSHGALAEEWTPANCFAYTAVSKGLAELNQPYTDVEIEPVRNSVDIERYSPPASAQPGKPIVAFVGRSTHDAKDFPRFTRIAKRLGDSVRIWIADPHGANWDAFDPSTVERITAEKWGAIPQPEMPDFYRAVAASGGVVLVTSRTEGWGNVAPEAAACGARVAATNVMGLREAVIDGETGRLFAADATDDAVAAMLREWMAAPHDMAACAKAANTAFAPAAMMDAYESIYRRPQQKIVATRPALKTAPENVLLLPHLTRQRKWRAREAIRSAPDLAAAGFRRLAFATLGIAWRAAPGTFSTRDGFRALISTVWQSVRPARA